MPKYENNEQLKKQIERLTADMNITKPELAKRMGITAAQLNTLLNKKNLTMTDLKKICDALGCEIYIEIRRPALKTLI